MRDAKADLELCRAATQAPWVTDNSRGYYQVVAGGFVIADWLRRDDAVFIVEAREAVPYWIAKAQKLQAENKWLREVLEYYANSAGTGA